MAKILLAWELGLNSGHAVRLAQLATKLVARGHTLCLGVQRPDSFRKWRGQPGFAEIRQAPVWPGLLRHNNVPLLRGERSWGDLLAAVGMHDSGVLEYMLRCWDQQIRDARPDLLITDFAPAAMIAARGRVPVLAVGTGFTVPPHHLPTFPLLRRGAAAPLIAEPSLLQVVNRALSNVGRSPLDRLTQIAEADAHCPATFAELDPYRGNGPRTLVPPFVSGELGLRGDGDAIFAYFAAADDRTRSLAQALAEVAKSGQPVTAWLPGIHTDRAKLLGEAGVRVLNRPASQSDIAAQSRLLVTTGGLGMASFALAVGLPMAIMPVDLEKRLTADAINALKSGAIIPNDRAVTAGDIAEVLTAAVQSADLDTAARAIAPHFRRTLGDPAEIIGHMSETLL